ncbi:MAG TPA: preprotein translocase subunit SecA, partial [Longimicrobiaceae bacterium]|nr:preprotein translocase subunit SecA [Longimicrobiaceae bacterium]
MFKELVRNILGTRHAREVKRMTPVVDQINAEWERLQQVSDEELKAQTDKFRAIIREHTHELDAELEGLREAKRAAESASEREDLAVRIGVVEKQLHEAVQAALDEILPEAYATVKEACRRLVGSEVAVTGQKLVWDMVPYDVQLIGGIALHEGKVGEMATGEGKTLVATMPLYLNALAGRGVHLVTVNSYLAQRDSEWMGHLYNYLGLTVDCIDLYEPGTPERRGAYLADITYGTNNEFGFDYLRDNMVHSLDQRVQRRHYYAIIDEVDSVLIDEARTPLIISGPVATETNSAYARYNPAVADLFRRQTKIVTELIGEAERALAEGNDYEAGEKLLLAKRGMPKNKRLAKIFSDDPRLQKLILKVEGDHMRDKDLHEFEEVLLFAMDEKGHNAHLTDQGLDVLAPDDKRGFVVPDLSEAVGHIEDDPTLSADEKRERREALEREYAEKSEKIHVIHQLLKGYALFNKDEQYVVQDGQIVIVDEFTGRMMAGRRWSDGLHQAVEAKEGVTVKGETQTLATITIQNYFRMYDKIAGMTGTAETEEAEFHQIYGLDVMVIPTNRPVIREDRHDLVYKTKREKYNAIIEEVERLHGAQLPVLVGTVSVDTSETLSRMLKRRGIPHEVLNAKYHGREAQIVAEAGQPGAVTIATNMAGRGTDIKLGPGVTESRLVEEDGETLEEIGGLHIIGSERHESRRIDRQLRGRAGRQGDPGASQFFLSLEDDLMRLFGSDRIASVMDRMGAEEGEVITHALITRSIGNAQKRVEAQNFDARKRLLDYDDVMNQQREVIYDLRTFALEGGEDLKGEAWDMVEKTIGRLLDETAPEGSHVEEWNLAELRRRLEIDFFIIADRLPRDDEGAAEFDSRAELDEYLLGLARAKFQAQLAHFGAHSEELLRYIVLSTIDERWKDHLYDLDQLKASIGFRGWVQKDPLIEYKQEAYDMFVDLMTDITSSIARLLFRARVEAAPPPPPMFAPGQRASRGPMEPTTDGTAPPARSPEVDSALAMGVNPMRAVRPQPQELVTNRGGEEQPKPKPVTTAAKVGRNDPCPCGSGKKYKSCHGA